MTGTTEAFSRVKIDALLKDVGWNLTDGVRFSLSTCCRTVQSPITSFVTDPG